MNPILTLTLTLFLFPMLVTLRAAEAAPSVTIRVAESRITTTDINGRRIDDNAAGKDDAAVLQSIIDGSGRGAKIVLGAGRYVLKRPLLVDRACLIEGEGRGTVLVPPSDDFAIRIVKTDHSPLRSELAKSDDAEHVKRLEGHLYPVTLRDLCIDGEGRGKGVFLERVFNATLQRVFVLRTEDGAGLFLGGFVMECVFDDVVVHSCGNLAKKEAAVIIASQPGGDASNNIRFRTLEVIFPRWNAVTIGAGDGAMTPRLIFFQQCFFHGQLPFEDLPSCDLINVARCEGRRGVVTFTDCRITNSHREHALLRVGDARVNVSGCVLGGGHGRVALRCDAGSHLTARGNTFHDDSSKMFREYALEALGGQVIFSGNSVDSAQGNRLHLVATRSGVITGNQFSIETSEPTIHLADDGTNGCANVVINDNSFTETRARCAIQRDPKSTERIEIHGNVFGGTCIKQAVIETSK